MTKKWTWDLFKTNKPIIAMCHFQPLPGDPHFAKDSTMACVVEQARKDLKALQNGGVDGIMFSNEFSNPWLTRVEPITVASMARVIGELLSEITVPFGVNVIWDPKASLDLAVAVGAKFVREIISGVYASDFGLWNTNAGETVRHQYRIGASDVKLIYNLVPEAAKYLAARDFADIARSTVFNTRPDALCVSGLTAGTEIDVSILASIKKAVPETVVFANNGVRLENVEEQLALADGAVVGTTFKKDHVFKNTVDQNNVKKFMDKVKIFRKKFDG